MEQVEAPGIEEIDHELQLRSLAHFVPTVSPKFMRPDHLAPLIQRIELAAEGIPQRVCCSAPPRHSKTETVLHVPAFVLRRNPGLTLSYSTYADPLSRSKSRRARRMVESQGIETTGSVNEWRTDEGGGLLAGGVGGPLTGHGVDIGFVDDPYKNRVQAESAAYRSMLSDWVHDVLISRIEPNGSIFIFATRWHPDDIIGEMIQEGFEFINLPALGTVVNGERVPDEEHGTALWPGRWTTEMMQGRLAEVGPYTAASLYQGIPRPRGSCVFEGVHTYTVAPGRWRTAGGTDSAYSMKKTADRSAVVKMHMHEGLFYVSFAKAMRVPAPAFKAFAHSVHEPGMTWRWYAATSELGAGQFMDGDGGIPLDCRIATADKFVRAIPAAAAWNEGKVFVDANMEPKLLEEFLAEMASFTGVNDKRDDLVDAFVAAYDELASAPSGGPIAKRAPWEQNRMGGM